MDVAIGVDIGQRVDPTAIAVCELQWRGPEQKAGRDDHWIVRHLRRLSIGTSYPDVVAELVQLRAAILERVVEQPPDVSVSGTGSPQGYATWNGDRGTAIVHPRPPARPNVTLYVDATGVGLPVVDLLDAADTHPHACIFVSGERRTKHGRRISLGKAWMVSRLQALAQSGRLHLPRTAEASAMERELLDYEIRVSAEGHDTYGAFKTGRHDDLVTALGLAVQATPERAYVY